MHVHLMMGSRAGPRASIQCFLVQFTSLLVPKYVCGIPVKYCYTAAAAAIECGP